MNIQESISSIVTKESWAESIRIRDLTLFLVKLTAACFCVALIIGIPVGIGLAILYAIGRTAH